MQQKMIALNVDQNLGLMESGFPNNPLSTSLSAEQILEKAKTIALDTMDQLHYLHSNQSSTEALHKSTFFKYLEHDDLKLSPKEREAIWHYVIKNHLMTFNMNIPNKDLPDFEQKINKLQLPTMPIDVQVAVKETLHLMLFKANSAHYFSILEASLKQPIQQLNDANQKTTNNDPLTYFKFMPKLGEAYIYFNKLVTNHGTIDGQNIALYFHYMFKLAVFEEINTNKIRSTNGIFSTVQSQTINPKTKVPEFSISFFAKLKNSNINNNQKQKTSINNTSPDNPLVIVNYTEHYEELINRYLRKHISPHEKNEYFAKTEETIEYCKNNIFNNKFSTPIVKKALLDRMTGLFNRHARAFSDNIVEKTGHLTIRMGGEEFESYILVPVLINNTKILKKIVTVVDGDDFGIHNSIAGAFLNGNLVPVPGDVKIAIIATHMESYTRRLHERLLKNPTSLDKTELIITDEYNKTWKNIANDLLEYDCKLLNCSKEKVLIIYQSVISELKNQRYRNFGTGTSGIAIGNQEDKLNDLAQFADSKLALHKENNEKGACYLYNFAEQRGSKAIAIVNKYTKNISLPISEIRQRKLWTIIEKNLHLYESAQMGCSFEKATHRFAELHKEFKNKLFSIINNATDIERVKNEITILSQDLSQIISVKRKEYHDSSQLTVQELEALYINQLKYSFQNKEISLHEIAKMLLIRKIRYSITQFNENINEKNGHKLLDATMMSQHNFLDSDLNIETLTSLIEKDKIDSFKQKPYSYTYKIMLTKGMKITNSLSHESGDLFKKLLSKINHQVINEIMLGVNSRQHQAKGNYYIGQRFEPIIAITSEKKYNLKLLANMQQHSLRTKFVDKLMEHLSSISIQDELTALGLNQEQIKSIPSNAMEYFIDIADAHGLTNDYSRKSFENITHATIIKFEEIPKEILNYFSYEYADHYMLEPLSESTSEQKTIINFP